MKSYLRTHYPNHHSVRGHGWSAATSSVRNNSSWRAPDIGLRLTVDAHSVRGHGWEAAIENSSRISWSDSDYDTGLRLTLNHLRRGLSWQSQASVARISWVSCNSGTGIRLTTSTDYVIRGLRSGLNARVGWNVSDSEISMRVAVR